MTSLAKIINNLNRTGYHSLHSKLPRHPYGCSVRYSSHSQAHFYSLVSEGNKARTQKLLPKAQPVRNFQDMILNPKYSYAAVLVPLCVVNGEPSLLLTLRSSSLTKHRGQVSFPGGNVDRSDTDFIHTALRETEEELGIDPQRFDLWGQMKPAPGSAGNKVVVPVVAMLKGGDLDIRSLRPSPSEVEEAFTVTLRHFCDPAHQGSTRFRQNAEHGRSYTIPVYLGAAHRIWGITSIIIHQLMTILAPDLYTYKVIHKEALVHRKLHSRSGYRKS